MKKGLHFLLLTTYLILSFVLRVNAQLITAATVQNGINPIYIGNPPSMDKLNSADLERLRKAGINTIIVSGYEVADFKKIVNSFNTNSLLNKFKVIFNIGPVTTWVHDQCYKNPANCSGYTQTLHAFLNGIVQLAKNNPVVGGYYTFDEPAIYTSPDYPLRGISKDFQISVYNYIRNLDSDINSRPVIVCNTMYSPDTEDNALTYEAIESTMSNDAQDIFFIDQYDKEESKQKHWFELRNAHGLTGKPFVFILPASRDANTTECSSANTILCATSIKNALSQVPGNWPDIRGVGFYAYWPEGKPIDTKYDLFNCPVIMNEACSYLSSLPSGLKAKWRLDLNSNDNGPLNATATPVNYPYFSDQYYVEGNGSMYLEGNGQGLELSPGTGFLKDAFSTRTIMFWVQPFSAPLTQILYEEGDSGNGIAIRIYQGTLQVATANFGNNQVFTVRDFNFPDSAWTHLAVVYNAGVLKVYINGRERDSTVTFPAIGAHWDATGLGVVRTDNGIGNAFGPNDNTPSFHGFFDDVQLYDVALSAEKVFFTSQALFGEWKWNKNTVNEGSGNTNGILRGGANFTTSSYEGSGALLLNGQQQGVELSGWGGFLRAEIKKRTIMFMMKPTALNRAQMLYEEGDSGNGIAIRLNANNYLEVGVACFGTNGIYSTSTNPITLDTWYHVVVIFNANTVTIYLNNHKASYGFIYPALNPHWDAAGIGMTVTNGGIGNAFGTNDATASFSGIIDNLKIYNSVIPESYLQAMCEHCDPFSPFRLAVNNEQPIVQKPALSNNKETLYIYSMTQHLFVRSSKLLRSYKLLDISGRTLETKNGLNANSASIDIEDLPSGVYVIQILDDKGQISTRKFIR